MEQTKVTFHEDWEREGALVIDNPKTIKRYKELKYGKDSHPDCDKYGVFFAITEESFDKGYSKLVQNGFIKDGEKICSAGKETMLYGTKQGIINFYKAYDEIDKKVAQECNPQEVYCYEFNNHEAMFDWDGDANTMQVIISIFGVEVAKTIKRKRDMYTIEQIQEMR